MSTEGPGSAESEWTGPERRGGDRQEGGDQRSSQERRNAVDRRSGLDRRRGPGRRRSDIRRAAEEGEMADELLEFVMAIDEYKQANNKPFPTWSEVFEIIQYLGYRRVEDRGEHINQVRQDDG